MAVKRCQERIHGHQAPKTGAAALPIHRESCKCGGPWVNTARRAGSRRKTAPSPTRVPSIPRQTGPRSSVMAADACSAAATPDAGQH